MWTRSWRPAWKQQDAQVIDRHARMNAQVNDQSAQLSDRRASNELARVAAFNARERYIDVPRATTRRYKKNVAELGELAGTTAEAVLPHLENDDIVPRRLASWSSSTSMARARSASTTAKPRRPAGLEEPDPARRTDEGRRDPGRLCLHRRALRPPRRAQHPAGRPLPALHRAQYLLTTPITHNVEVFEPSEITLVTSKKPRGERWAPPIGVLVRRPEVSEYA